MPQTRPGGVSVMPSPMPSAESVSQSSFSLPLNGRPSGNSEGAASTEHSKGNDTKRQGSSPPSTASATVVADRDDKPTRWWGHPLRVILWAPQRCRYDEESPPRFTMALNLLFAFVGYFPASMATSETGVRLTHQRYRLHASPLPTFTITNQSSIRSRVHSTSPSNRRPR